MAINAWKEFGTSIAVLQLMPQPTYSDYESPEELAEDIVFVAQLMLRYGDWIAPILDRLEGEMELMTRSGAPRQRALAAIEKYRKPGGDA